MDFLGWLGTLEADTAPAVTSVSTVLDVLSAPSSTGREADAIAALAASAAATASCSTLFVGDHSRNTKPSKLLTSSSFRQTKRRVGWRLQHASTSDQQEIERLTCGQSVVNAFMFMIYSQLANDSLKVARESLRFFIPSRLAWRASVSSTNSAMAGSRNPRPCGASGYAPEWDRAKREPWEILRSGVRWGVGLGMV
jgi:hypothetical protein